MTDVTVVIPTHNRRALLARAVNSALQQNGVDVEVVVCDDGSTDGTADALARIDDSRLHAVTNITPQGVSAARNRGAGRATGDWLAFLDDDDVWAPNKLSDQLCATRCLGRDWACAGTVMVDEELRVVAASPPLPADDIVAQVLYRNVVPGGASGVMVRTSLFERLGGFDQGLRHLPDWDLWIRLSAHGPPAVVDRPVVAYVLHRGNASLDSDDVSGELRVIDGRYAGLRDGKAVDRPFVYRWVGSSSLRAGRRSRAVLAYGRAVLSGDLAAAPRVVASLVYPPTWLLRRRRELDSEWARAAESWLSSVDIQT